MENCNVTDTQESLLRGMESYLLEIRQLQAENKRLQDELDLRWGYAKTVPGLMQQATKECAAFIAEQRKEIEDWKAGAQVEADEGDKARTELARQRPVIDAARRLRDSNYTDNWSMAIAEVLKAIRELDYPVEEAKEVRDA